MNNLTSPNQARIPIGTVVINGQQLEVIVNMEWARFFESLTSSTNANTAQVVSGKNGIDGVSMMLGGDGSDAVEFVPGPPGPKGDQGMPGPALFMLQDTPSDEPMLMPPPASNSAGAFATVTAAAGFGCNGKAAQSAAASGGTLAGVIAALVANGILSS